MVVDCTPPEPPAKRHKTKSLQSVTESSIIPDQSSESTLPAALPLFVVASFAPSRHDTEDVVAKKSEEQSLCEQHQCIAATDKKNE